MTDDFYILTYYTSILTLTFAIIIGIGNYKSLKKLKLIFLILILSFIQIFISEILWQFLNSIIPNFKEKWKFNGFIISNVYTFLEFSLILAFLKSINKNQKSNNIIITLFLIGFITYITPLITKDYNGFIMLKYFSLSSGIIVLVLSLFQIKTLIKSYDFENKNEIAILIICIGIFLSNLILWPTLVIQSLVHIDFNRFYKLLVIANSSGYIVLHLFSSIAFYGKNKSRIH